MRRTLIALLLFVGGFIAFAVPSAEAAGSCPQWHDLAVEVGWTDAQYARISPIMWRESRCFAGAINHRSGDYGLVQVHVKIWGKICHMSPSELLDQQANLACGLTILRVQGMSAWGLRR